jgi:hypothetical protein
MKSAPPDHACRGRNASDGSEIERWVDVIMPPRMVLPLFQSFCRRATV